MYNNELRHHGVKGMKWGVRRYETKDGHLTAAGKARYGDGPVGEAKAAYKKAARKDARDLMIYGAGGRAIKNAIQKKKTGTSTHEQYKDAKAKLKSVKEAARNTPEAKAKREQRNAKLKKAGEIALYGYTGYKVKQLVDKRKAAKQNTAVGKAKAEYKKARNKDTRDLMIYGAGGRSIKNAIQKKKTGTSTHEQAKAAKAKYKDAKQAARNTPEAIAKREQRKATAKKIAKGAAIGAAVAGGTALAAYGGSKLIKSKSAQLNRRRGEAELRRFEDRRENIKVKQLADRVVITDKAGNKYSYSGKNMTDAYNQYNAETEKRYAKLAGDVVARNSRKETTREAIRNLAGRPSNVSSGPKPVVDKMMDDYEAQRRANKRKRR